MTIFHDAYLFDAISFATDVAPVVSALCRHPIGGYQELRNQATIAFDENLQVRMMADNYGGWDRSALQNQPDSVPTNADDVAFWFMLLIYQRCVRPEIHGHFGLNGYWRNCQPLLQVLDWPENDIRLLIEGRRFDDLARLSSETNEAWPKDASFIFDTWHQIHPASTSSCAGWLDHSDVRRLLNRLAADIDTFRLNKALRDSNSENAYQCAAHMLMLAEEKASGLCLIRSG